MFLSPGSRARKKNNADWRFSYETLTLSSGVRINALKIASRKGGQIPIYIDEYGHLLAGDLYSHFPNLLADNTVSSSLDRSIGPALRVYGDMCFGDVEYFGATSASGLEVQQIGVRIKGAYASATHLMCGETNLDTDNTSGSYITLRPDDANQGTDRGAIDIVAYGQSSTGNEVRFYARNGVNAKTLLGKITAGIGMLIGGAYNPGAAIHALPNGVNTTALRGDGPLMMTTTLSGTGDGSLYNYTKEHLFQLGPLNISGWQTLLTLTPSTVTSRTTAGMVSCNVMGRTTTQGTGTRSSKWGFFIAGAAPTVSVMGTDLTAGSNVPQFRLSTSGNNIIVQVQSSNGTNLITAGLAEVKLYLPDADGGSFTWTTA